MSVIGIKALDEGVVVFSNYKLNWKGNQKKGIPETNLRYWSSLGELVSMDIPKGSLILMDEAHVYLNSRRWQLLPEEMERRLAQHGKDGLHIIATVQNIRRLDTVMRELVDYWYTYQVFPPPPKKPWRKHRPLFFRKYEIFPQSDLNPFPKVKLVAIYPFRKKWAEMYNTYEKVETSV